ncbi:MAG: DUF3365 domain-containing protein [Gemmatimonadetes bacterium]|nr:DUF3365 domain-containing protein [Gemmatimonadota bacterium]NNM07296.1 DUF3365 domain-containing protein [Gemmatimonadota bacterium]
MADSRRKQGCRLGTTVLFGVLFCGGAGACGDEQPSMTVEEGQAVVQVAEPAASELLRTLVGHLTSALEERGPAGAMEFCSREALPLTREVQAGLKGGLKLKRTSFRVRNPLNAPDGPEEEALLYFEEAIMAGGKPPASFVQKVSDSELRFYRPLFIADVCTRCHGPPENLDEGVRAVLSDRYPMDLATGYEVGDFRGVVRVSIPAAGQEG